MLKVLIVEDEEMIRKGIVMTINWAALDCAVVGEASNGIEALEAVKRCHPTLIITDLHMPQMDGIEFLQALRDSGDETPVIILTAYDSFSYAQSALRLGVVDYLLKPFHDGDLERAIAKVHQKISDVRNSTDAPAILRSGKGSHSKYVTSAIDYIRLHYNDPDICVGSIAEHLGISEGHLSHTFKKETDYTPLNYLTRYRIQQSMLLLRDVSIKVYEVAEKVGYRDIAYFSSTFKKLVGVSPSEYQSSHH